MFLKEGRYTSLTENKIPETRSSSSSISHSHSSSTSTSGSSAAPSKPTHERRPSLQNCVVAGCRNPRVSTRGYCGDHANSPQQTDESKPLVEAIDARNAVKVLEILKEKGSSALFKNLPTGQNPIEYAFSGFRNTKDCGIAMIDYLKMRISELEAENKLLKEKAGLSVEVTPAVGTSAVGTAPKASPKASPKSSPKASPLPSPRAATTDLAVQPL